MTSRMSSLYISVCFMMYCSVQLLAVASALELAGPDYASLTGGCPPGKYGCSDLTNDPSLTDYFERFTHNCSVDPVLDSCGCSRVCPQEPYQPCGGAFFMFGMCVRSTSTNLEHDHYCTLSNWTRLDRGNPNLANLTGTCLPTVCKAAKTCCDKKRKPVCGLDGKWYYNSCIFNRNKKCYANSKKEMEEFERARGKPKEIEICGSEPEEIPCEEWRPAPTIPPTTTTTVLPSVEPTIGSGSSDSRVPSLQYK